MPEVWTEKEHKVAEAAVDYSSEKQTIAVWAEAARYQINSAIGADTAEGKSALVMIGQMTADYYAHAEQSFRAEVQEIFQP